MQLYAPLRCLLLPDAEPLYLDPRGDPDPGAVCRSAWYHPGAQHRHHDAVELWSGLIAAGCDLGESDCSAPLCAAAYRAAQEEDARCRPADDQLLPTLPHMVSYWAARWGMELGDPTCNISCVGATFPAAPTCSDAGWVRPDQGAALTNGWAEVTQNKGWECAANIDYVLSDGLRDNPLWYEGSGLTQSSSRKAVQAWLYYRAQLVGDGEAGGCELPCGDLTSLGLPFDPGPGRPIPGMGRKAGLPVCKAHRHKAGAGVQECGAAAPYLNLKTFGCSAHVEDWSPGCCDTRSCAPDAPPLPAWDDLQLIIWDPRDPQSDAKFALEQFEQSCSEVEAARAAVEEDVGHPSAGPSPAPHCLLCKLMEILVVLGAVGVVLVLGLRGRSASGAPGGEPALKRDPEEDAEQPAAAVRATDPTARCPVTCSPGPGTQRSAFCAGSEAFPWLRAGGAERAAARRRRCTRCGRLPSGRHDVGARRQPLRRPLLRGRQRLGGHHRLLLRLWH